MPSAAFTAHLNPGEELKKAVETFLSCCRKPEILEPGERAIPVQADTLTLKPMGPLLHLEAIGEHNVLFRRVTAIRAATPVRMELVTQRLGGKRGKLFLYDAFRPSNEGLGRKGRRQVFGEEFRRMLQREFTGWRIAELSTEPYLEESLSPAYPRALLRRGRKGVAAMAAPIHSDADGMLSFALIWLDYLRRREPSCEIAGLGLFLPAGRERTTCLRLLHLNRAMVQFSAYTYGEDGLACLIDLADSGNIDSSLHSPSAQPAPRFAPEAMIEDQVRSHIESLDATLCPAPVYGQVCSLAATDRGIFDLLAIDISGRLAVIELKASESIHLPLQALDYWIHVQYHLSRGALSAYFPGIPIRSDPPRLLLAAPALCHHSTNERIVRYFRPDIPVERIGLAHTWNGPVRVLFRHK